MTTIKNHLISSQTWKRLLLPALAAGSLLALPASLRASLPNTGSGNLTVIFGSATYPTLTNATTGALNVTATSTNTVLGWTNFSDNSAAGGLLASGDLINFILPTSTSAILNQVTGGAATVVNGGTIASNGKIFLLNPAGVFINQGAAINAASFYASTIPETLSYFETNGTLQAFTATPPANSTSGVVVVDGGVQLSTIGGNGTIGFAGNSVYVGGTTGSPGGTPPNEPPYIAPGTATNPSPGLAAAVTVVGNLYLESQGGAINLSSGTGGVTVGSSSAGGALTVLSNGGAIDLANGSATTIFGAATVSSVGGAATGNVTATNAFTASTAGTLSTINAGTTGAVTLPTADFASIGIIAGSAMITDPTTNTIALGTSTIKNNLSVTSSAGSINNTGAVAAGGTITLSAATNKSITFSTTGNVTFGPVSNAGGSGVTITGTGNLVFGTVNSPVVSITTTGGTYSDGGITASSKATISASGNVTLGAESVTGTLTVTSGGTIAQSAAILNATKAFLTAPTITLNTAGNNLGATWLQLGGGGGSGATPISITDAVAGPLVIGNGTSVTGQTTITNGANNIVLGTGSSDTLSFGSGLTLTTTGAGTISTVATTLNVAGPVSVTTAGGSVLLGVAASANTSLGQVSATTVGGALTINETTTTNLGASTLGGGLLTVTSGGSIVNTSGVVSDIGGNAILSAGTVAAPQSIQLGASGASANGFSNVQVNIGSGLTFWGAGGAVAVSTNANPVATESLFITDGSALTVNSVGAAGFGTLSFNVKTGAVTVTDPTSVVLTNLVDSSTNVANNSVTATTGSITLGSGVALGGSGNFTLTASAGTVTDTASSPVMIYGPLLVSAKSIAINNNTANSVGPVTLTTTAGSAAYVEGGPVTLAGVSLGGTSGTLSISSVNGNITQTGIVNVPTGFTAASFSAPAGSVTLGSNNTIAGGATIGITASGTASTASLINVGVAGALNTTLGNVYVPNGALTVSTIGGGTTITQATGTSIFEYGSGTFNTNGSAVTLNNAGNNFGGLTINTTNGAAAGANIKIQETGTDNLASINAGTGGSLTVLDTNGSIIQSTSGGITAFGGSFTAPTGSITLTTATNTFQTGAVLLSTTGNASLTDMALKTQLADGTAVTGNLTVTNKNANGIITDSGSSSTITVGGTLAALATTTGSTGDVQFVGSNSTFGSVELQAGNGTSSLLDNGSLVLLPSSNVLGNTTLTSAGNISTTGSGGSSFGGSLTLVATGSIIITNPVNVANVLTVDAVAGPTNLSFLSKTANLNSKAVVNDGNTTNYTGPSP